MTLTQRILFNKRAMIRILKWICLIITTPMLLLLLTLNVLVVNKTSSNIEVVDQLSNSSVTEKPNIIILLSSFGRSGSSFTGDLLATKENTVLFYEPAAKTEHDDCSKVSECMVEYIKSLLTCKYTSEFETWFRSVGFYFFRYHPLVTKCRGDNLCKQRISIRQLCKNSDYRITKLIRVRLGFMETLIKDPSVNTKVIYLVRDPRAAAYSYSKLDWDVSPICSDTHSDMAAFEYLKEKYPNQLFKIQYELLSLQPLIYASEMFKFAYGDKELPPATELHIKEHTEFDQVGDWNTKRISKDHYQEWRLTIPEKILHDIETDKYCKVVFKKLQYNVFNTIANCRNLDIPMIKKRF